jgi:hypothetical protein
MAMVDGSCRPPRGKTYLCIGQDLFSIDEYVMSQYNASLHRQQQQQQQHNAFYDDRMEGEDSAKMKIVVPPLPLEYFVPPATMMYTDLQTLRGLADPADYGSGIEYAVGLAEAFPTSGMQVGLWLNGTTGCRDVVDGTLDGQISKLFDFVVTGLPPSVPKVFLRVGYEFDNPWFGYSDSPSTYREAFRKIVAGCRHQLGHALCSEKVAFVWHSWAAPRVVESLDEFYPGDDMVDWVGVSIFQQLYPWANGDDAANFAGGNIQQVSEVLEFAKVHQKPIMIAESTPFGGMDVDSAKYNITDQEDVWDLWFQKALDLIEEHDISIWSYINCDWDSQPMWHGVGFGDTRLSSSKTVMSRWWEHVLKDTSRFLHRIENCNGEPGDVSGMIMQADVLPSASRDERWIRMMMNTKSILTTESRSFAIFLATLVGIVLVKRAFDRIRTNGMFQTSGTPAQVLDRQTYQAIP